MNRKLRSTHGVSVVVPSFNKERYLESTLRSILNQDFTNLELIVMDGGSTDGSVDILRRYDDHIAFWRTEPDGGQGAAVVEGWKRASGDFITWINADDVLLPGSLRVAALELTKGADLVFGDSLTIDKQGLIIGFSPCWIGPSDLYRYGLLTFGQPGTFYRRSLVEHVNYFDENLEFAMEHDLTMRLLAAGAHLTYADRPLGALRKYEETKTAQHPTEIAEELQRVYESHINGQMGSATVRQSAQRLMRLPYSLRYMLPRNMRKAELKRLARSGGASWSDYSFAPGTPSPVGRGRR